MSDSPILSYLNVLNLGSESALGALCTDLGLQIYSLLWSTLARHLYQVSDTALQVRTVLEPFIQIQTEIILFFKWVVCSPSDGIFSYLDIMCCFWRSLPFPSGELLPYLALAFLALSGGVKLSAIVDVYCVQTRTWVTVVQSPAHMSLWFLPME